MKLEGIIVSTGCWRKNQNMQGMNKLNGIVKAYGEVLPNLSIHADGYPSLEYMDDGTPNLYSYRRMVFTVE